MQLFLGSDKYLPGPCHFLCKSFEYPPLSAGKIDS